MRSAKLTNLITITTSNEILDRNVLKSTVSDPSCRPVLHDQSLASTCVCLSPIADQLNPIKFTGCKSKI